VSAYDPRDGQEIWSVDLPGWAIVPRPVWWSNRVHVCTGGTKPELWAIRADGRGVVNETHVAWKFTRQVPMVASPVLVGERLYMVSEGGIATALDLRTGREIWSERIGGRHYASPLAAGGRIYFFGDDGRTTVVAAGPVFQSLATNRLDAGCMATPALIGPALFMRTKTHLYRIEGEAR
jgi:outer membrane protein assembly factor BamB